MFKPAIHFKLFVYIFTISIFSLAIISLAVYFLFFQSLLANETRNIVQSSDKTKQNVEFVLDIINNTGTMLGSNKDLLEELKPAENHRPVIKKNHNKVDTLLQNVISVQQYIKGIHILTPDGELFTNNPGVNEMDLWGLFEEYINYGMEDEYYTNIHDISYSSLYSTQVISHIRPVYDPVTSQFIAIIIIDIDYDLLKEMLTISSIQSDEKVLLVSLDGQTIFNYPYNVILDTVIDENPGLMEGERTILNSEVFGKKSIIVSNTIDETNWKYIRIISSEKIRKDTERMELKAILFCAGFIIIAFFSSLLLSAKLTRPVKELNEKFKQIEKGDLTVNIRVKSRDELGELGNSFNNMVTKLKLLIETLLSEQKRKSDMEFQILQAQINPHFLYNTLDSIKWLAVLQNVNTISDMTTALINLLKYNISRNSATVPLSEELESVNNYIIVQKYRYGDIFSLEFDIDENTRDLTVLRFILQPIVENAIIHGFENIEDKGVIKISSKQENGLLKIVIQDNGAGMDEATLKSIMTNVNLKNKFSSIGIQNIQERIKAHFGDDYGLFFESSLSSGTRVTLKLPLLPKSEEQQLTV